MTLAQWFPVGAIPPDMLSGLNDGVIGRAAKGAVALDFVGVLVMQALEAVHPAADDHFEEPALEGVGGAVVVQREGGAPVDARLDPVDVVRSGAHAVGPGVSAEGEAVVGAAVGVGEAGGGGPPPLHGLARGEDTVHRAAAGRVALPQRPHLLQQGTEFGPPAEHPAQAREGAVRRHLDRVGAVAVRKQGQQQLRAPAPVFGHEGGADLRAQRGQLVRVDVRHLTAVQGAGDGAGTDDPLAVFRRLREQLRPLHERARVVEFPPDERRLGRRGVVEADVRAEHTVGVLPGEDGTFVGDIDGGGCVGAADVGLFDGDLLPRQITVLLRDVRDLLHRRLRLRGGRSRDGDVAVVGVRVGGGAGHLRLHGPGPDGHHRGQAGDGQGASLQNPHCRLELLPNSPGDAESAAQSAVHSTHGPEHPLVQPQLLQQRQ
eukprot:gene891-biopygen12016